MERLYEVEIIYLIDEIEKKGTKKKIILNDFGIEQCKMDKTVKVVSIKRWC